MPALLAAALALYRPTLLNSLDNAAYDAVLLLSRTNPPGDRVVIVDVDERSLSTIGQWPWRRDRIAELVARLREMGAAIVALDVIFAEPDRFEGSLSADRPSRAEMGATPDEVLAETLREGRVVLGYAMTFDASGRPPEACVLHSPGLAVLEPPEDEDVDDGQFFSANGAVCSLPLLARAAGISGFLNAAPDSDGILRRVPLLIEFGGRIYPSLALAAVASALHVPDLALRISNINSASVMFGERIVPVDGRSNLLLRYRGVKRTFTYVSAADVLNGQVPSGFLHEKVVFVGATALGTREVVATPLDTLFAGVEVQATVADNLLEQDFFRRHELGATLEGLAAVVLSILIGILAGRGGPFWAVLGGFAGLSLFWYGAVWRLSVDGAFVSPLFPTLGAVGALAVVTLARFGVERRRADSASEERTTAQRLMVQALLSLTEVRDAETGSHSRRTQEFTRVLAQQLSTHPDFRLQLTPERINLLSSLAPLHDIGKVGVPDRILNKPGPLTPDELAEMRKHPIHGRDVILKAEQQVGVRDDAILEMAKDIVYTHHERWDGTGYPQGLRGPLIPIAGRLLAVVDVYDAVTTREAYAHALPHDQAVDLIAGGSGTHFDPAVVDAFLQVQDVFKMVAREGLAGRQVLFPGPGRWQARRLLGPPMRWWKSVSSGH